MVSHTQWHSLTRDEQAKYYEKARQERQLHMELYPGWSARDNYGYGAKKKKRKKERVPIVDSGGGIPIFQMTRFIYFLFEKRFLILSLSIYATLVKT